MVVKLRLQRNFLGFIWDKEIALRSIITELERKVDVQNHQFGCRVCFENSIISFYNLSFTKMFCRFSGNFNEKTTFEICEQIYREYEFQ